MDASILPYMALGIMVVPLLFAGRAGAAEWAMQYEDKPDWRIVAGGVVSAFSILFWLAGILWFRDDLEERGIPFGYALFGGLAVGMCLIAWGFIKKNRALVTGRSDRVETLRQVYRDVEEQLQYITNPEDVCNARVNLGQSIRDHINADLFLGWKYREKLRTRVNGIVGNQYNWREKYPDLTASDAIFQVYLTVLEQGDEPTYVINSDIDEPLQRIEAGVRALMAAAESSIRSLGGTLQRNSGG